MRIGTSRDPAGHSGIDIAVVRRPAEVPGGRAIVLGPAPPGPGVALVRGHESAAGRIAQLGAAPILAALDAGAAMVAAGPTAPGAAGLAALRHGFGWPTDDWDRLAAGLLCGRMLEAAHGPLIAECADDGTFELEGPASRIEAGLLLLAGLDDPARVAAPDVTADFRRVRIAEVAPGRVAVAGARGAPPDGTIEAATRVADGFTGNARLVVLGADALARAEAFAERAIAHADALLEASGLAPFRRAAVHLLGAEHLYGPDARPEARESREVALAVHVEHESAAGIEALAAAWPDDEGGVEAPRPEPLIRRGTARIRADAVSPRVELDGVLLPLPPALPPPPPPPPPEEAEPEEDAADLLTGETARVALGAFAVAVATAEAGIVRIGVMARRPEFSAVVRPSLTAEAVRARLAHLVEGEVERHEVPGIDALVFVLHDAETRLGPPASGWAELLLDYAIEVPAWWVVPGPG